MIKKDIIEDPMVYLRSFLVPLEYLAKNDYGKKFKVAARKIKYTMHICEGDAQPDDYDDQVEQTYSYVFRVLENYLKSMSR